MSSSAQLMIWHRGPGRLAGLRVHASPCSSWIPVSSGPRLTRIYGCAFQTVLGRAQMCQVYNGSTNLSVRRCMIEKGNLFDHHKCFMTMSLGCRERKIVGKRVNSVNACRTSLHSPCHAGVRSSCVWHTSVGKKILFNSLYFTFEILSDGTSKSSCLYFCNVLL